MFRRTLPVLLGAPPKKKIPGPKVIHQAQRPGAREDIDFTALGLTYPLIHPKPAFDIPSIGWAKRPDTSPEERSLPFLIERTENGGLPVYTDIKGGNTKKVTIIRRIKGDPFPLQSELTKVVQGEKAVEIRPGKIVIDGNYSRRVKLYLLGMGF